MANSRNSPTLDVSPNDEPTKRTLNTSIPSSAANSQSSSLSSFSSGETTKCYTYHIHTFIANEHTRLYYSPLIGNNNQESAFTDTNLSVEELSTSPVETTQQTNGLLTTFKTSSKEGNNFTHVFKQFLSYLCLSFIYIFRYTILF